MWSGLILQKLSDLFNTDLFETVTLMSVRGTVSWNQTWKKSKFPAWGIMFWFALIFPTRLSGRQRAPLSLGCASHSLLYLRFSDSLILIHVFSWRCRWHSIRKTDRPSSSTPCTQRIQRIQRRRWRAWLGSTYTNGSTLTLLGPITSLE